MLAGCTSLSHRWDVLMHRPSQLLSSTGGCATCRDPGQWGLTEDPQPPPLLSPSHQGNPRHGMRRGLEPRARKRGWRAAPVPKAQQDGIGEQSPGKGLSAPLTLLPQQGIFQAAEPPASRRSIFSHMHLHHSGTASHLTCICSGPYKHRDPSIWPTI